MTDNSKVQTLSDFVRYGYTSSYSIQSLSLFYKENDIVYLDKLIYQKYDKLIMGMTTKIVLTDIELMKYQFSPETLSNDLYGTPNLSHLICYINKCPAYLFKRKNIRLISPNYIAQVFQKIIEHEQKNLTNNYKSVL